MILKSKLIKFGVPASLVLLVFLHFYVTRVSKNLHYGKVFYHLGLECQDKCTPHKQLAYFRKAIFYDPNFTEAYYQMGILYGREGQAQKAFASYKRVAMLDHRNADAYFRTGFYYLQKEYPDQALRYLLHSERYNPDPDDMVYWLAETYYRKKMYQEAAAHYLRLLTRGSPFSTKACRRVWQMSKIPGQYRVISDEVYRIRIHEKFLGLWEQIDRYLKTDQIPEFMLQSSE